MNWLIAMIEINIENISSISDCKLLNVNEIEVISQWPYKKTLNHKPFNLVCKK